MTEAPFLCLPSTFIALEASSGHKTRCSAQVEKQQTAVNCHGPAHAQAIKCKSARFFLQTEKCFSFSCGSLKIVSCAHPAKCPRDRTEPRCLACEMGARWCTYRGSQVGPDRRRCLDTRTHHLQLGANIINRNSQNTFPSLLD